MIIVPNPPTYNVPGPAPLPANVTRATLHEMSSLYASLDRYELAKTLRDNFDRFVDPDNPGFLTLDYLQYIALGLAGNQFTLADQVLVFEVLNRAGFAASLDLDEKGESNRKFDRQDIHNYQDALFTEHEERTAGPDAR
ncbi:hypothetical protein [Pseudomonas synxantha]|uniref:hypothetical protein n=1 Tax=Pseudomonas synxantha TaxID=47883 RepID=UPI00345CBD4A